MKGGEFDRAFERFKMFLNTEPVVPLLSRSLSFLLEENRAVDSLEVNDGLRCYTRDDRVYVSCTPYLMRDEFDRRHWLSAMRALLAHEVQHDNSSDRNALSRLRHWYGALLCERWGLDPDVGRTLGQKILNCLEDARVDNIVCGRFPGYVPVTRFVNYTRFDGATPRGELADFLCDIESYALTGLIQLGTSPAEQFDGLRGYIDRAALAESAAQCAEICRSLLSDCAEYLARLCARTENLGQLLNEIRDTLQEYPYSDDDRAEQKGSGEAGGSRARERDTQTKNFDSEDGEDADGEKGDTGGSGSGDNSTREGEENGSLTGGDVKPQNNAGINGREDRGESSSYGRSSNHGRSSSADTKNSDDAASEKAANEGPKSIREVLGAQFFAKSSPALTEKEIETMLDTAAKELERENESERARQVGAGSRTPLSMRDMNELKSLYDNVSFGEEIVEPRSGRLPAEYQERAKTLHKRLDRILREQRQRTANQRKGSLSREGLWKVPVGAADVFERKSPPTAKETAFYLLIDRSGSMGMGYGNGNSKLFNALITAAVIEEALKGLAYTKVVAFDGGLDTVEHYVIKDFKQKEFGSRCFDALTQVSAGNGNKDGYSIRVAAMDLGKRSEKRKVLVVLSDGLPSAYRQESDAIGDVRTAVQDARRRGIIVIPIIYGSADSAASVEAYVKMYEKGIISTTSEKILGEFEKLLMKLIQ